MALPKNRQALLEKTRAKAAANKRRTPLKSYGQMTPRERIRSKVSKSTATAGPAAGGSLSKQSKFGRDPFPYSSGVSRPMKAGEKRITKTVSTETSKRATTAPKRSRPSTKRATGSNPATRSYRSGTALRRSEPKAPTSKAADKRATSKVTPKSQEQVRREFRQKMGVKDTAPKSTETKKAEKPAWKKDGRFSTKSAYDVYMRMRSKDKRPAYSRGS